MSQIERKIRELGQKNDADSLKAYITTGVSTRELSQTIDAHFSSTSFVVTWNYILKGLQKNDLECHDRRFKISLSLLKNLQTSDVANSHCSVLVERLCSELTNFRNKQLVELCDFCIESLQIEKSTQLIWKDLLPELLNVVSEKEKIISGDDEIMTGPDFKHSVINRMCLLKWSPNIITPLTSMFSEMTLTKEEHLHVVKKLCQFLEQMTPPQEVPALVYQLLNLCKIRDGRSVFLQLLNYFSVRIYDNFNINTIENSSENTDVDIIESTNNSELTEAESTVFFHIHAFAFSGHNCINEYLISLKNMSRSPEYILHPFQLSVLMTISTVPNYEEKVFDMIRSCISRTYHEDQKKSHSAWLREMVPNECNVAAVFGHVIAVSSEDRDLVLQGLVNFAFLLLGVGSALGRDLIAEKQWQLGNSILLKIIKRKRYMANVIVEKLCAEISWGISVSQYIECLYMLSRSVPLLITENKAIIITLLEKLVEMPHNNANQLLDAVIPLIRVSPTIRDNFIMHLRRALYSRNTKTKQMAVNGYLKLITNLKIQNLASASQGTRISTGSFSSGHSLYTQISISRISQSAPSVFSNEGICLEVLGILQRCFMQQADVKKQLYQGLYEAVSSNSELGAGVLTMLQSHFNKFYKEEDNALPPLKFDTISLAKDIDVILQEPLGRLVFVIGQIVTNVSKTSPDSACVKYLNTVLTSLSDRMAQCELVHFHLDDGVDLLDILPESQQKRLVLKETLSVYEALIAWKIWSWDADSANVGKDIWALFQAYSRVADFAKNLSKPKKGAQKKKKPEANATTQNANSTTQHQQMKKDNKHLKNVKLLPNTVLNIQVLSKTVSLLYEDVSWVTKAEANVVKTKRDFHQYVMQSTLNLVSLQKNKKIMDTQTARINYGYLTDIACVLYEHVVKKFTSFIDFDCTTGILALECFHQILALISNQYRANLKSFLSRIGDLDKSDELIVHLQSIVEIYQKLFELDPEEISDDPEIKKLAPNVINTLNFVSTLIPTGSNALSIQISDWLKTYISNNQFSNKNVANGFITLAFETVVKNKKDLNYFDHVAVNIGNLTGLIIDDEEDNDGNTQIFKGINELTVSNCILSLCNVLKSSLHDVDWIIARLKSELSAINCPGGTHLERRVDNLKRRERGVACHLCLIATTLTRICNFTVPTNINVSDPILKDLASLYNTLTTLTRYFTGRSSKVDPVFQSARFERLVKLVGRELSPRVNKMIDYIEENQIKEIATQEKSRKQNAGKSSALKNKVLRETRLIPKVVFEMEQFSNGIVQLTNKTKVDLAKYLGQGTTRDFRIHRAKLLERVKDGGTQNTQEDEEDEEVMDEADETADKSEVIGESGEESDVEASPPPSKKSKC